MFPAGQCGCHLSEEAASQWENREASERRPNTRTSKVQGSGQMSLKAQATASRTETLVRRPVLISLNCSPVRGG